MLERISRHAALLYGIAIAWLCRRSGGSIRSVAVTGAYLAAAAGGLVGMIEVIAAVAQEYRRLAWLVLAREFGDWLPQPR